MHYEMKNVCIEYQFYFDTAFKHSIKLFLKVQNLGQKSNYKAKNNIF